MRKRLSVQHHTWEEFAENSKNSALLAEMKRAKLRIAELEEQLTKSIAYNNNIEKHYRVVIRDLFDAMDIQYEGESIDVALDLILDQAWRMRCRNTPEKERV